MERDPTRMCELLVGLPSVVVLGIEDLPGARLRVQVSSSVARPFCEGCGLAAVVKDRPAVELVDLPCFGRATRLVWPKHRWACSDDECPVGSWTGEDERIGFSRLAMTDRAGRWLTEQIGRYARSVNEVAIELGCDWHTVNDTLIALRHRATATGGDRGRPGGTSDPWRQAARLRGPDKVIRPRPRAANRRCEPAPHRPCRRPNYSRSS